ncbi:O-antigen ligase family protein [Akkermansiaceae bacterium]|nr:O-antigen ligase family protein [Akkermansiaceae bacterium]
MRRRIDTLGAFFFTIGIGWIWATGGSLDVAGPSLGLILIGLSIVCSASSFLREEVRGSVSLGVFVFLGGLYFIGSALYRGPVGLAVPDVLLVLFFWASYFGVIVGGERALKLSVWFLVVICVAHVVFVFHQRYFPEAAHFIHGHRGTGARPAGLFWHHNPFAAFSNSSLFLILFLGISWLKGRFSRWFFFLLALGLLWATWQSGSRGGWLSFVAGAGTAIGCFYLYLRSRKRASAAVVALIGVVAIVIAVCTSWAVMQIKTKDVSARAGVETEEISIDGGRRLEFMPIALDFFIDEPVLGNGARSFSYKVIEEWDPEILPLWLPNPEFVHNEFLQALCDYGIVGFLILFVGCAAILFHGLGDIVGLSAGPQSAFLGAAKLGAFAGLGAILAQCFFSFLMHIPACIAMSGFLAGVLSLSTGPTRGVVKDVTIRLLGGGVGIVLVATGVILFSAYYGLRAHRAEIGSPMTGEESLRFIEKGHMLAKPLFDPEAVASNGQIAMGFASDFDEQKDPATAAQLREKALSFFKESLILDPNNQVSLAAVPQVLTALGRYQEAEEYHVTSLERLHTRERFLNPAYFAALTSYLRGYQQLLEGNIGDAESALELSITRMKLRHEFPHKTEIPVQEPSLKKSLAGWDSYFRGRRLYQQSLKVWRKRDAESAMALALAAEREYLLSQEVAAQLHPCWREQWEHLQGTLKVLRDGQVRPSRIPKEEIEQIAAGLELPAPNR